MWSFTWSVFSTIIWPDDIWTRGILKSWRHFVWSFIAIVHLVDEIWKTDGKAHRSQINITCFCWFTSHKVHRIKAKSCSTIQDYQNFSALTNMEVRQSGIIGGPKQKYKQRRPYPHSRGSLQFERSSNDHKSGPFKSILNFIMQENKPWFDDASSIYVSKLHRVFDTFRWRCRKAVLVTPVFRTRLVFYCRFMFRSCMTLMSFECKLYLSRIIKGWKS